MKKSTKKQSESRSTAFLLSVAVVAMVLVAGCAVLNVDVDVYKGQLANHEDIQTEQVAAMAMGAKPLLISMRDLAECEWNQAKKYAFCADTSWYQLGFISPGVHPLTNDLAVRVNAILSLYEDRPGGDLTLLLAEERKALRRCEEAYNILHRSMEEDQRVVDAIKLPVTDIGTNAAAITAKRLAKAYRNFLVQTKFWRTETNIFEVCSALEGFPSKAKYFGDLEPVNGGPNASFLALQDPELLSRHANILYPTNRSNWEKYQGAFSNEVFTIAQSFTQSRAALAQLWRLNLGNLVMLDSGGSLTSDPLGKDGNRQLRISGAANLAGNLVEVNYLSQLLIAAGSDKDYGLPYVLTDLVKEIVPKGGVDADLLNAPPGPGRDENLRRLLIAALEKHPARVASALVSADEYFVGQDPNNLKFSRFLGFYFKDYPYMKLPISRQYGLSRGLTREARSSLGRSDLGQLGNDLDSIGSSVAGFSHGRLEDGLQTLIENYLRASHDAKSKNRSGEVTLEKRRLLDALVGFAEKIKFISDNQELVLRHAGAQDWITYSGELLTWPVTWPLSGFPNQDWSLYGGYKVSKAFGATNNFLKPMSEANGIHKAIKRKYQLIFDETEIYQRARPSVQALQAVGNSIISQVDALAQSEAFNRRSDVTSALEWGALTNAAQAIAARQGSNNYITNLFGGLPPSNTTTRKEALDTLISLLRDLQITATAAGDTNAAQQSKAAEDLATTYRNDQIFIRPPSAYLRNSYPATSLQPDANIAWQNMLDRHSWRSLPLFGETIANWGIDVNTVKEIDKQYWQNINRVRVAGVGITSYAVTKDDIGNWYVKSYTGDPTPIIEGAKSLALYGVATSTAAKGAQAIKQAAQTTNAPPQPALLQKQVDHFTAPYLQDTTNQAWEVHAFATNLCIVASSFPVTGATTASLISCTNYFNQYLTNAYTKLSNSVKQAEAPRTIGGHILEVLNGVDKLQKKLSDNPPTTAQTEAITKRISVPLADLIAQRLTTVSNYEAAVKVLSDSVTN